MKIILHPKGGAVKKLGAERNPTGRGGVSFIHTAKQGD